MQHNISKVTKTILIIELCVAFYMIIVLFMSLYDSFQIETYISNFENKNHSIQEENKKLQAELAYYTSEQYQDKIAKQNFGLVNPGEEVLVLPHTPETGTIDIEAEQLSKRLYYYENLPNYQKWWKVLTQS